MNRKDGLRGGLRPKKISDCLKDRDEELSFFRDIQKRGKEQVSLLQPVSEEFDANGLYGMESTGRKGAGLEFLGEAAAKNDYNWLKTPPATPLFPSLEMETNGKEMVIQTELPIIQPLSRFSAKDKGVNTRSIINSNPKIVPPRYKTPNARPNISLTDKKTMKNPIPINQNQTKSSVIPVARSINPHTCSNLTRATEMEEKTPNFLASNLKISMLMADTKPSTTNPKSRGISPSVRPRIPAQIQGFPGETPANLRITSRPESATRGRPSNQNASTPQTKQADISTKTRSRQSCSPSVTRGRKAETDGKVSQQTGNGTQVLGSRMVEKLMNARISNAEQRQGKIKMNVSMDEKSRNVSSSEERVGKIKLHGSMNERPGFGRLVSKGSLDMAIKHKEFEHKMEHMRIAPGRK